MALPYSDHRRPFRALSRNLSPEGATLVSTGGIPATST